MQGQTGTGWTNSVPTLAESYSAWGSNSAWCMAWPIISIRLAPVGGFWPGTGQKVNHGATKRDSQAREESREPATAKQAEEWGQFERKSDICGHRYGARQMS